MKFVVLGAVASLVVINAMNHHASCPDEVVASMVNGGLDKECSINCNISPCCAGILILAESTYSCPAVTYTTQAPGSTSPGSTLPGSTLPGSTLPGSTLPAPGSAFVQKTRRTSCTTHERARTCTKEAFFVQNGTSKNFKHRLIRQNDTYKVRIS